MSSPARPQRLRWVAVGVLVLAIVVAIVPVLLTTLAPLTARFPLTARCASARSGGLPVGAGAVASPPSAQAAFSSQAAFYTRTAFFTQATNLDRATRPDRTVLACHEPDMTSQANLPVERALQWWPQRMHTGGWLGSPAPVTSVRLGSPAPATGAATPGGWLDRFMSAVAARGYRADFIALHWYGCDFSPDAVPRPRRYPQATSGRYYAGAVSITTGSPTRHKVRGQHGGGRSSTCPRASHHTNRQP